MRDDDKVIQKTKPSLIKASNTENVKPHTAHPSVTCNFENGSFLVDTSSNEAMDNSSPIDADDLGAVPKRTGNRVTSDPYWNISKSKSNDTATSRRANIGEKRTEAPMLSPISDGSQQQADPDDATRFIDDDEDDGIVLAAGRRSSVQKAGNNSRVWLDPSSSDEKLSDALRLRLPLEGPRTSDRPSLSNDQVTPTSDNEVFLSASSLPALQVDNRELGMSKEYADADAEADADADAAKAIMNDDLEVTQSDRERAQMIFNGDEELVSKAGAAAWLGQTTPRSTRTRKAYMELFDWTGLSILAAF
jgi:hypothetical protein